MASEQAPRSRRSHWDGIYNAKNPTEVSWYQPRPDRSLALVARAGLALHDAVLDVGAGASTLVDGLVGRGFSDITLVDVSAPALETVRKRLGGASAAAVRCIVADVTRWRPPRTYALWHDRAVFHFLTSDVDRAAYVKTLTEGLRPGGHAIVATFAPGAPDRCSGLPVRCHGPKELEAAFQGLLNLEDVHEEVHVTPEGARQPFLYGYFRRPRAQARRLG